jgi:hypothetical protein
MSYRLRARVSPKPPRYQRMIANADLCGSLQWSMLLACRQWVPTLGVAQA